MVQNEVVEHKVNIKFCPKMLLYFSYHFHESQFLYIKWVVMFRVIFIGDVSTKGVKRIDIWDSLA